MLKPNFNHAAEHTLLTTGMGLSTLGVPLRLPALLIPGLEELSRLKKEGKKAEYVVYQATDFIVDTNKLDPAKARKCAAQCEQYLNLFIDRFYPDLKDNVRILSGNDCKVEEGHLQIIENHLEKTESDPGTPPSARAAFEKLRTYAQNHKGGNLYRRYAAANILLNGGYGPNYPLVKTPLCEETTIVPMGGKREKPFFDLTSYMAETTGCAHKVVPLIVEAGRLPAYNPIGDEDLLVGQNSNGFRPGVRTQDDFDSLKEIGASIEELAKLGKQAATPRML